MAWITVRLMKTVLNQPNAVDTRAATRLAKRLNLPAKALTLDAHEAAMVANVTLREELDVDLADVAGCDALVDEIKRDVLFQLQHPNFARSALMTSASGVLLFGPPGTGKTMLAKV